MELDHEIVYRLALLSSRLAVDRHLRDLRVGTSNPCGLVKAANDPFLGPVRGFSVYLDFGGYAAQSV